MSKYVLTLTLDFICNWAGNLKWTLALEWSGQEAFNAEPLRNWTVGGEKAGITRSAKGFTFATVEAAGHMVSLWAVCSVYRN